MNTPNGHHATRPWPLFGYAPGNYTSRCYRCDTVFENADKKAIACLECAVKQAKEHMATIEGQPQSPSYAGVTDAMIEAGLAAYSEWGCSFSDRDNLTAIYLAMRAADTPPTLTEEEAAYTKREIKEACRWHDRDGIASDGADTSDDELEK